MHLIINVYQLYTHVATHGDGCVHEFIIDPQHYAHNIIYTTHWSLKFPMCGIPDSSVNIARYIPVCTTKSLLNHMVMCAYR